ncbi:MAG: tRNA lysidine(34) synthetase TilS [Gemmatimonadetes bacterium]|nr:tRNA lysidine(34) synthetase TilS [Gemmatimonadota bacterium]
MATAASSPSLAVRFARAARPVASRRGTASAHLVVGHVDHGIAKESAKVAESVGWAASARGLRCFTTTLHLDAGTTETKARLARRTALRALATDGGATVIVLAHHADDQAETVLLRLLRGSGPAGLAGMAPRNGPWVRPLLDLPRERLAAHVVAEGIVVWQDPANRDIRHLRSWLRQRSSRRLPHAFRMSVSGYSPRLGRPATPERGGTSCWTSCRSWR